MSASGVGKYLVWVFGVTFGLNLVTYLFGGYQSPLGMVLVPAQMFIPAVVAIFMIRREGSSLKDYGLRWGGLRFYALAYLLVLGLHTVHALLLNLVGWGELLPIAQRMARMAPEAELPAGWILAAGVFLAAPVINLVFGLGEEFGWRGYLSDRLMPRGLLYTIVWSGVIWGLWHAPVILMGHNYPNHPWWGVLAMTAACVPLGAIFLWLRLMSGSAVVVGFAHGAFNALFFLGGMLDSGVDLIYSSLLGLSGIPVLALTAVLLFVLFPPGKARGSAALPESRLRETAG